MGEAVAWAAVGSLILILLGAIFGHPVSKVFGAKDKSWNDPWPLWKKILWGVPLGTFAILMLILTAKQ